MNKIIVLVFMQLLPLIALSQNGLKTTSISIFRDGSAFFIKEGKVSTNEGKFILQDEEIPKARFGTLWFSSKDSPLASIKSYVDTVSQSINQSATDITDLLSLNEGARVVLKFEDKQLEGEIKKVEFKDKKPTLLHLLTANKKWISLNPNLISMAEFYNKPKAEKTIVEKKAHHKLEVKFTEKETTPSLRMMYLQRGLRWNPFYYLEMINNKKAEITLRLEVVNDAEDIKNVEVNFVVGTPNFKYTGKLVDLVKFKQLINPAGENNIKPQSYAKYPYAAYSASSRKKIAEEMPSFEDKPTREGVENYHFYTLKNVDLPKHSKAHFELFSTVVNYENIYECNLNKINYRNLHQNKNKTQQENKVYHSIKIQNNTENPFAEAPVFILKNTKEESKPLSQDLLKFTPKQGKRLIRISEAPEVEVINKEFIVKKAKETTLLRGKHYYKVTIKGVIDIKNYKNKSIRLEVRSKIEGDLVKTTPSWEILWQKPQTSLNDINFVQWDIALKKEEKKTIMYEFETYIDR